MVLLPVAWFSAGLARERVVISGDFRQLSPIISTQEQEIFEALGHDSFSAAELTGLDDPRLLMLDTHTVRSEICNLIAGPMYDNRLTTAPNRKSSPAQPPPMPFDSSLTVIDSSDLGHSKAKPSFIRALICFMRCFPGILRGTCERVA